MSYQTILYEVKDRVAHITLNRPEKMNALSYQLRQEVIQALKEAEHDDNVGCIIIKGAGRAFSAGYDISPTQPSPNMPPGGTYYSQTLDRAVGAHIHDNKRTWLVIWELHKVVIAQVHGYCIAGGSELANMCDLFFVADDTQIGYPPIRAQGPPEMNYFPWKLPMSKANYMVLTGKSITGKQAVEWGMATASFPVDQLAEETEKIAKGVASIAIDQLAMLKRSLKRSYDIMGFRAAIDVTSDVGHYPTPSLRGNQYGSEFSRVSREQGLKAALQWRDGPWGDYGQSTIKPRAPGAP
ncbi:MAG: enoyl-CoA hydratase/isomerase family protein [Chloroflexi bacterium]|nr:enoyl-CoA hydratase/isomerase family protein [Chloroflexota bacterium]